MIRFDPTTALASLPLLLLFPQSLMQRALAAEAEAELVRMKLAHALEELREDRAGYVAPLRLRIGSISGWVNKNPDGGSNR